MDNRVSFLSRVSLIFIVYFGICLMITTYIHNNLEISREAYVHARLNVSLLFYIIFLFICKVIISLFGTILKKLSEIIFIIDLYLTYMTILGLYFYLSNNQTYYTNESYYLIITANVFFYSSIAFFLSTFTASSNNTYNFALGFLLMTLTTIVCLISISKIYDEYNIG